MRLIHKLAAGAIDQGDGGWVAIVTPPFFLATSFSSDTVAPIGLYPKVNYYAKRIGGIYSGL